MLGECRASLFVVPAACLAVIACFAVVLIVLDTGIHGGICVYDEGDRTNDTQPKLIEGFAAYSKYKCHGTPIRTPQPLKHPNITCRFENVCYDLSSEEGAPQLLYFHDGSLKPQEFPSALDLRPAAVGGVLRCCNGPVNVNFKLVSKPIPNQSAYFRNPVAVLFQPIGSENFGHQLADNMYGVYAMQQIFRIADPFHAQLLTFGPCDSFQKDSMDRSLCKSLMPKMYRALSKNSVLQLRTADLLLAHGVLDGSSTLLCFHTLLVSPGANSFRIWGEQLRGAKRFGTAFRVPHWYWGFRLHLVYHMLGPYCADVACSSSIPVPLRILILIKSWKDRTQSRQSTGTGLINVKELQDGLSRRFPKYRVQSVDLATLAFGDQISLITQAAFMFSHGGGGSFGALFLPRHATLAVTVSKITEINWMNTLWFFICILPSRIVDLSLAVNIVGAQRAGCLKPLEYGL